MNGGDSPDRNLAMELVRVTEAAALGAGRWVGRGDKEAADQAAVDAMRHMLATVEMEGVVGHQSVPGGLRARSTSLDRSADPMNISTVESSAMKIPQRRCTRLFGSPGLEMNAW